MAPLTYAYPPDYDKIGSWFLGPKAENHGVLEEQFRKIVAYFKHGRESYCPDDPDFITSEIIHSEAYRASVDKLDEVIEYMSVLLAHHVVPFSSPRYAAHVVPDTNLPAVVGYLLGLLYNQNNVTPEASPLTGVIEYIVGQDICHMLGFKTNADKTNGLRPNDPVGWGHVTCDGSVANYEGVWMARSMKYYPLSLQLAIKRGALKFVGPEFKVLPTGKGRQEKPFIECTPWELLNLKSNVILDLPDRLAEMYDISTDFLSSAVDPWLVQAKGMEGLHEAYGIKNPPKYFVCLTKHYSLKKAASILGIGVDNLIDVTIDNHARMDPLDLKTKLDQCIKASNEDDKSAIFGVLAIIGSTEHSAVDPLVDVLDIRQQLEDEHGVSFLIHCDAAWGGYFTSLLRPVPDDWTGKKPNAQEILQPLLPYVVKQLENLHRADSITVDSHKSGYCPYPAGGLCYRDERMRLLIAVTSPYINTTGKGVESMGTYGLEGSKPGAAPLAVWTANVVIGLHQGGYGRILSEAIMTGVRYYSMWLTMKSNKFISIPLNEFPIPAGRRTQDVLDHIHNTITTRPYGELITDHKAMDQVRSMGADLMINTFACNFKLPDGTINTDPAEANYLNDRIYDRLSLRRITDNMNLVPLILVGTVWTQAEYQGCLKNFKKRLGLREDDSDLHTFSSVAMSPFVTDNFAEEIGTIFKQVTEEEVERCWDRIVPKAAHHNFLLQGTDQLFLVHLPMFNVGSHRQQIVLSGNLDPTAMKIYIDARAKAPSSQFTLHTVSQLTLDELLTHTTLKVNLVKGLPLGYGATDLNLVSDVTLSNVIIIKNHSLAPRYLSLTYPEQMPLYLYGTASQVHVDHVLLKDQNVQLTASQVLLDVAPKLTTEQLNQGLVAILTNRYENSMQPCSDLHKPEFFKPGAVSKVSVYADPFSYSADPKLDMRDFMKRVFAQKPIASGTLTLGEEVYNDAAHINQDLVTSFSISVDHKADTREVLKNVRGATKSSDIWLSHDVRGALHRKVPGILHGREGHLQRTVHVSRFALQRPHDQFSRVVATRDQWRNAVESIGRAR